MDRDDARFTAGALTSRIAGDREALDRLQVTSLVRLTAAAAALRKAAADWSPALLAASELDTIAKWGAAAPALAGDHAGELQKVVDSLNKVAAEPVCRNRRERRAFAKQNLSRRERLGVIRAGVAK